MNTDREQKIVNESELSNQSNAVYLHRATNCILWPLSNTLGIYFANNACK